MPPQRPDMSDQERSMAGVTKQMSLIFPVMIFAFSFLFPEGLAIYWATGRCSWSRSSITCSAGTVSRCLHGSPAPTA